MDKKYDNKSITIKEIAKIVGISPMTVSRAINDHKYVKEETKKKIFKAINEHGYVPNIVAQSLRTKKSKTIGLIITDIENPFYSRLAKGAIIICEKHNYNVIVCNSDSNTDLGKKYVRMLLQKNIDGMLIATLDLTKTDIKTLKLKEIPFVLITCKLDLPNVNYYISDDYYGSCILTEYLIDLGHKKIFFLKGMDTYSTKQRLKAFKDTLTSNKIHYDEKNFSNNITSEADAYTETENFLKNNKGFTAIMAINDYVAISAMEVLRKKNYKIPDDISIVGYDNLKIGSLVSVPLTTVKQPKFVFGEQAAKRLIEMIENPNSRRRAKKEVFKPKLIIRESCRKIK